MNREIPEAEALALTVRGDVPGVLAGFTGPVEYLWPHGGKQPEWIFACVTDGRPMYAILEGLPSRLPLARPEVQAHLVGWLGRGERCDPCRAGWPPGDGVCRDCRPRHNCYPWLTPEALGGLPDWIRLALIAGSVERVAAGMGPIRGLATDWVDRGNAIVNCVERWPSPRMARRDCGHRLLQVGCLSFGRHDYRAGWRLGRYEGLADVIVSGPETGEDGIRAAEDAALNHGFALIDNTPAGRVIRFEVPE